MKSFTAFNGRRWFDEKDVEVWQDVSPVASKNGEATDWYVGNATVKATGEEIEFLRPFCAPSWRDKGHEPDTDICVVN